MLERWVTKSWYGSFQWTRLLWPLMWLYQWVVVRKRNDFLANPTQKVNLPVIVVGNITAGGTGKTPVVLALVEFLQNNGYRPAIVTRGYGGALSDFPHHIIPSDTAFVVGDEPYMMSQSTTAPVIVDANRKRAAQFCFENKDLIVDIVISDDGLQHYALNRDIEICVIDEARGLGNQKLIPVGPLREPISRLNEVDFILKNGGVEEDGFILKPQEWVNLKTGESMALEALSLTPPATALAGIGNPQRFFDTVAGLGFVAQNQGFPDHHAYTEKDMNGMTGSILMTHKDAVKIAPFATPAMWYLKVVADLPETMRETLLKKLSG